MKGWTPGNIAIAVVRLYQRFISPLLGPHCRFYPSCSEYAVQAIRERGLLAGLGLAALRILRCHPFNPGGYDPVPPRRGRKSSPSGDSDENRS